MKYYVYIYIYSHYTQNQDTYPDPHHTIQDQKPCCISLFSRMHPNLQGLGCRVLPKAKGVKIYQ